mgnify:CR=1 FL=1|tara:strand:+ start:1099 stop:1398 length:300 start_codon:yes stop_codon:yes gene_type:complete
MDFEFKSEVIDEAVSSLSVVPKPFLVRVKVVSEESVEIGDMGLFMFVDEGDMEMEFELLGESWEDDNPGVEFRLVGERVEMGFSAYAHDVVIEGVKVIG